MIEIASPLPHASYERFESLREYEAMFDELIPSAQQTIRVFEHGLTPVFNSPARCERLARFARAGGLNRLHVVVHATNGAERVCPRFISLSQRFSHVVKVRQTPRWARHVYDRFAVFDGIHYVHCFHHESARFARGMNDLDGAQQLLERFDELWEASRPALGASVLGL
jgi:hypothetical protein